MRRSSPPWSLSSQISCPSGERPGDSPSTREPGDAARHDERHELRSIEAERFDPRARDHGEHAGEVVRLRKVDGHAVGDVERIERLARHEAEHHQAAGKYVDDDGTIEASFLPDERAHEILDGRV